MLTSRSSTPIPATAARRATTPSSANSATKRRTGLIVHTAGFDGDVFRIFDVWESEAHWKTFHDERLTPAVEQMMAENPTGAPPVRESTYELHDILPG